MRAGNTSMYAAAARFFRIPALAQATDASILQRLMEEHHVLSRPVTLPARFLSETRQPMWVNLKDGGELSLIHISLGKVCTADFVHGQRQACGRTC